MNVKSNGERVRFVTCRVCKELRELVEPDECIETLRSLLVRVDGGTMNPINVCMYSVNGFI